MQTICYIFREREWVMKYLLLLACLTMGISAASGQVVDDTIGNVLLIDRYERVDGFNLYMHENHRAISSLVVFTHGYGALNPMVYGGWIQHPVSYTHLTLPTTSRV